MVSFPAAERSACPSKNALLLLLLSTCMGNNRYGVAFIVSPQMSRRGLSASIRRCHSNACPCPQHQGRSGSFPRRQPCLLVRAAAEGSGGGTWGEGGKESGDSGAASGMGLEGDWQVKSGEGKRAREGSVGDGGVGSVPGQLPDKDWAEWAREWREDPQGKADRLVEQWDAESKANGGAGFKDAENSKKRNSKKKKKKGKAGPSRGVVGTGFGGAVRQSKSVPKGLVVAETGGGKGDVVDWSTGQQLVESDRKDNMSADWDQDAKRLENLGQSDREELADKLRMALGKQRKKRTSSAPSGAGGGSKGFSTAATAAAGGNAIKGEGVGRDALASAADAAGAMVAEDVAGVSVFPAAPAAAAAGGSATVGGPADQSHGQPPPSQLTGDKYDRQGDQKRLEGFGRGVAIVEPATEDAGSSSSSSSGHMDPSDSDISKGAQAAERPPEYSAQNISEDRKLSSVLNFGRGVSISGEAVVQDGGEERSRNVFDKTSGSVQSSSTANREPSNFRNFERGASMPAESAVEEVAEEKRAVAGKDKQGAAANDIRVVGFGRGVAFPVEPDAGG